MRCLCTLVWGKHHDHVSTVEKRLLLDRAELFHVLGEPYEEVSTALRVERLAPPEHDRDLDLGSLAEKAHDVPLLGLVVVYADLRSELDLLDVDLLLVLPGLLGALVLLVPVLRVVHHPAYGRTGLRRHLDQVEVLVLGALQRLVGGDDPHLLAVGADQAHLRHPDPLVDPSRVALGGSPVEPARDRH